MDMNRRKITWPARGRATALALALVAQPALADDDRAEDYIAEVAAALGDRRLDEALALLGRAEAEAKSSAMRAKVERQRAFVLLATAGPEEALAAFVRARRLDPRLTIGTRQPTRAQETLFACAGTLAAEGRTAPSALVGDDLGGWECPPAAPAPTTAAVVAAEPKPQPTPEPKPQPTLEPGAARASIAPTPTPATAAVDQSLVAPATPEADGAAAGDGAVPTLSWVLGGAAVASAAAGGALGAMASSAATDRDPTTPAGGLSMGANIAFGVATATLVGGLLVWLTD
jgi:2-oxoglutarate dehydrogenase E2 component (dihydrolipoamide succinyltransferase)